MPKLNKHQAKAAASATSNFDPLPDDVYEAVLHSVEIKPGTKAPYWSWEFRIPDDAEQYAGRRLWVNTSLSPDAAWKMNEVFTAFGVPTDTDTDDLCGRAVLLQVGHRTIQEGNKKGEVTNEVGKVLPLGDDGEGLNGGGEDEF